jgi:hypothetical protein
MTAQNIPVIPARARQSRSTVALSRFRHSRSKVSPPRIPRRHAEGVKHGSLGQARECERRPRYTRQNGRALKGRKQPACESSVASAPSGRSHLSPITQGGACFAGLPWASMLYAFGVQKHTLENALPFGVQKDTLENTLPSGVQKHTLEDALPLGVQKCPLDAAGGRARWLRAAGPRMTR